MQQSQPTQIHNHATHKESLFSSKKDVKVYASFRLRRLSVLRNLFFLAMIILLSRAVYLQVVTDFYYKSMQNQRTAVVTKHAQRGMIFDRNNQVLAHNLRTYRVAADPSLLTPKQVDILVRELPKIYPDVDPQVLRKRLSKHHRRDALIKRHATQAQVKQTKAAKIPLLYYQKMTRRVYPKKELAGPVLGFVRIVEDPNLPGGRSGIEQAYDWLLQGSDIRYGSQKDGRRRIINGMIPKNSSAGRSLKLTIDMRIQQLAEAHLKDQVREMEAKSGVAVVMDPFTGDVLALAQVPSYDPNRYNEYPVSSYHNRIVSHPIEPGSTIKPFLIAAALNEKIIGLDTKFLGHDGRFRLGEHLIRDSHPVKELSTLEVIKYSSNIGAIQVAQQLGKKRYYSYLKNFGFGDLTNIGLNNESRGKLRSVNEWGQVHLGTFSYGYGFSATPLQLAQALCVIANGGKLVTPRLVKAILNAKGKVIDEIPVQVKRTVISKKVADIVTRGLIMVTEKGGTGYRSQVEGYVVAGKTGTARKIDPSKNKKGYSSSHFRASFMGFAPAHNPRLVIYINVDEPQVEHYGGKVAAPIFAKIVAEALPFLGVPASKKQREKIRFEKTSRHHPLQVRTERSIEYQPWWLKDRFLTNAPEALIVPELRGKDLQSVFKILAPFDLDVKVTGSGVVVNQSPESGELLPKDQMIQLTLQRPNILAHRPDTAEFASNK